MNEDKNAEIQLADSEEKVGRCFPVMRELRLQLTLEDFIASVKRQTQQKYQLVYVEQQEAIVAVAGFRIGESLAWGKYLYVDDLVTASICRSQGYGKLLLQWLRQYGKQHKCVQLHLDSGVHRKDAHRFYVREGMTLASYHYAERLLPE